MATITAGHRHWQLCEDGSTRKHKVRPQAYSCYEISIVYIFTNVYTYIYIHEICLNSKAFRVHDNIYNIDNLTKTHFWHIVDITYNLFTYHRSCSGAKKNTKKLSLRHKNSHHFHKQDIFFLLTPKWDVYVSPNCRSGKRFENVLDASFWKLTDS